MQNRHSNNHGIIFEVNNQVINPFLTFGSMNFLAHLYLSGNSEQVMLGNFIGDAVKGKHYRNFPELVQKGITLHRFIDHYMDTHPISHKSKILLSDVYGKHAGIIVDIYYDHFLTRNWSRFADIPLREYIYTVYDIMIRNSFLFPPRVKRYFPFFILNSWMESYSCISGIEDILGRMSKRTSLPDQTKAGIEILMDRYLEFEDHFLTFFPEVIHEIHENFGIDLNAAHVKQRYLPSA